MISATDSFIQYLSAGLAGNPPVSWVHFTPDDATSADLKMDSLNISVLGFFEKGSTELPLISLDIITADERQGYIWVKATRDLLLERQYTPELDYQANPSSPVATGRCVYWDGRDIDFKVVRSSTRTIHLNATFQLYHVRQ